MPKLLFARAARDAGEERQLRRLAGARHAPGDWITRARIVVSSWDGMRVPAIAERLGCHPETVRRRLHRFSAESIDGLGESLSADVAGQLALARNTLIIRDFTGLSTCSAGFHCRAPISACRYRPAPKFLPRLC